MKTAKFLITGNMVTGMPDPFRQLCVLEPGLLELWGDAVYYRRFWGRRPAERERGKDASWAMLKIELAKLAGPRRADHDDILGSSHAYDCAYRTLLEAIGA